MHVVLLSGQVFFSPFGEIWLRGGSPEAYMQKSPGKTNLTWEETLAARLIGCRGSTGHLELAAAVCTEARQGIRNWARGSAAFETGGGGVA